MEHYAGLDVSLELTSVCIVDAQGGIVRETKVPSEPEALVRYFDTLELSMTRIALEAGVPILPVTVKGANRVWSQTMKRPKFRKVEIFYHPLFQVPKPAAGEDFRAHLEKVTAQLVAVIESPLGERDERSGGEIER